jgi:hypothetical protein
LKILKNLLQEKNQIVHLMKFKIYI